MDAQEIQALLRKITYKPGWSFDLRSFHEPFGISIGATVPNSRENAEHPYLTMRLFVWCDSKTTPQKLLFDIATIVSEIEIHEALEFFRYKNRIIFDPHDFRDNPIHAVPEYGFNPENVEL